MAFVDEVGYYAGSTSGKNSEISKFLTNGVQWVINQVEKTNPDMMQLFASLQTLNNSSPTLTLSANAKILDIVRDSADSGGEDLKCSPINPAFRSNAENVNSLYYASVNSPVYYILNGVLTVLPTPTASQTVKISIVLPDTTVDHNHTSIDNFPSELYHAVILYAAGQLVHNKMTDVNAKLPTDLDADTTPFNAITDIAASLSLITLPTFAGASKSLPNTISITSSLPTDYGITTTLPTLNISTSHNAEYLDALASAKALIDVDVADDDGTVAQSAAYWLADEDEDMTQATLNTAAQELQRAASYLAKFQADINKEVQEFTVDMQTYQAEIAEEQAKANLAAAKVQSELSVDSTIASTDVAIYQAELQREQTRFNAEITKYQADVQGKMESLNYELQEWNANLQKKISLYTTVIGKLTTDYQWLQGQYQIIKAELFEFMAPYTTGGTLDSTVEGVKR
tara:strand:+ start:327 stop:1697 length:1371 start_codon:yes stop_codon:yes gene_type:complete